MQLCYGSVQARRCLMDATSLVPIIIPTNHQDLVLRQLTVEDAGLMFRLIDRNRSHLSQYGENTSSKYPTIESAIFSVTHPENPDKLRFGIWLEETFVGSAGLTPPHPLFSDGGSLGYWLGSEYTGQGIATAASEALLRYANVVLHWPRIFARVHTDNHKSRAVLERSGFHFECERGETIHLKASLR
ncbi:MAG: sle [Parcubacteria group bacterium]|nr:sle [Parcubacteria group bacterium]